MLDLESAIKHCEEVAEENEKQFNGCPMKYDGAYANNGKSACKCAEEHRQLAEWLKELKALREVCISKAFDMAIEALGQTDTLDKIRTEIDQYLFQNEFGSEYRKEVSQIINKYKAESEG